MGAACSVHAVPTQCNNILKQQATSNTHFSFPFRPTGSCIETTASEYSGKQNHDPLPPQLTRVGEEQAAHRSTPDHKWSAAAPQYTVALYGRRAAIHRHHRNTQGPQQGHHRMRTHPQRNSGPTTGHRGLTRERTGNQVHCPMRKPTVWTLICPAGRMQVMGTVAAQMQGTPQKPAAALIPRSSDLNSSGEEEEG